MGTPVSGPGQFSQRTDKAVSSANASLPNAQYGEAKDYQEAKSGAPLAQSGGSAPDFASLMGSMAGGNVTPLDAESARPDEPVTAGASMGPGPGVEALSSTAQGSDAAYEAAYIRALEYIANQPGSSDMARNLVRKMKYAA